MAKSSTSFKPGQSGNPGGRPKEVAEVRELSKERTVRAINTLTEIMEDGGAAASARVAAAECLLNRAWGKATTVVDQTTHNVTPEDTTPGADDAINRALGVPGVEMTRH